MKSFYLIVVFTILSSVIPAEVLQFDCLSPIATEVIEIVKPERKKDIVSTLLDKHLIFAEELYRDSLISVQPEIFAQMLVVLNWCESGFKLSAKSDGQQGIYQFTASTRRMLGIPKNILGESVEQQNSYYRRFLEAIGKNKTRLIKTVDDLHSLNFAPARRFGSVLCSATVVPALEFVADGVINYKDIRCFEKRMCKRQPKVYQIYQNLLSLHRKAA